MTANERELRVRELRAQQLSQNAIARALGISRRTVQRIYKQLDQGSSPVPGRSEEASRTLILEPVAPQDAPAPWGQRTLSSEVRREQSDTPATPSSEPPQGPDSPGIGNGRQEDAAAVGAESASAPARVEALPQIAQRLQHVAMRINQIEAPQLHHAGARTRRAEETLGQALRGVQDVRAEQWKMMCDVTQSVGELLQATGQLLRQLPGESG